MSGCCSTPREIFVETHVLMVDGKTCSRCTDTIRAARVATDQLAAELASMNVTVSLIEQEASDVGDSNTVLINGRPIESLIGAQRVSTDCPSCTDLTGRESCCGALQTGSGVSESVTEGQIRQAVMVALDKQ